MVGTKNDVEHGSIESAENSGDGWKGQRLRGRNGRCCWGSACCSSVGGERQPADSDRRIFFVRRKQKWTGIDLMSCKYPQSPPLISPYGN